MKLTKNISFIFLLLITVIGCNKEEEEIPSWSDVSWYTEAGGFAHSNFVRNTGEAMSFLDLSQGVNSHEWVLDSGNYFIGSEYQKGEDLRNHILPDLDRVSTSHSINVLFTEAGFQGVRLHNTYYHPVTYIGKGNRVDEAGNEIPDTLEAHLGDDGMWVIDTTFYVNVFAPLEPEMQIEYDGEVLARVTQDLIYLGDDEEGITYDPSDNSTWPSLTVPVGESIIYRDLTTIGRPETRTWTFPQNSEIINFYEDEVYTDAENSSVVELQMLSTKSTNAGAMSSERLKPDQIAASETLKLPLLLTPEVSDIRAAYEVYKGDELILKVGSTDQPSEDESTWAEIVVEKGDQLKLVDVSYRGIVDYSKVSRTWNLYDGTTATDSVSYVAYNDLTSGDEYFKVGTFQIDREKDNASGIEESTDSKVIPLKVKVEIEQRPTFKEGDITSERNATAAVGVYDKLITFNVSENLQAIVDQDLAKQSFEVKVSNSASGLAETVFDIASVSVSDINSKKVEIRLVDEIYNSDQITVAYTGQANNAIISEAGASLEDFAQESVILYGKESILDADRAGFEIDKDGKPEEADGWFYQGTNYYIRTTDKAFSGNYSMSFDAPNKDFLNDTRDRLTTQINVFDFGNTFKENDPIRISFKIYIPTGSPFTDGLVVRFQSPTANVTQVSTAGVTRDQWEDITIDMISAGDLVTNQQLTIMIQKGDLAGVSDTDPITFYLDDISMTLYEARP
ncbi:hypothetical protein MY04_4271 [Flammeovirga sp. MY04]|uniref:hypothetical protein n=1 Tax=Flammeovirga sp. MY04 TaxID=1191459 RepID=UPI0008062B4D|nr:hypothetical protein [Flammeovirga sp. MY04]ANQ51613.1 hypothetical protein MY04_4271 [Flammeovirga sp. MY04]